MEDRTQEEIESASRKIRRVIGHLQAGLITPREFCHQFFEIMIHAARVGSEAVWNPCLHLTPPGMLKLANDYADAAYKPIDYDVDPAALFSLRRNPQNNDPQERRDCASMMRRLHQAIESKLRSFGPAAAENVEYPLPGPPPPGDPPRGYFGVNHARFPYGPNDLAARMTRYLAETDETSRKKFHAIQIPPQQMPMYDDRLPDHVWVVARQGPQVIYYDHYFNWLGIGWILSTGKLWDISTAESLPDLLREWPMGPIRSGAGIDIGHLPTRDNSQLGMVIAAYGQLENTDATRTLLRDKIHYYLEQIDYSDKTRELDPTIILACDNPPAPDLHDFLEEMRRHIEQQRVAFRVITGAYHASE